MMRGGGPMGMMMGMADHTEGRIAFLRRELKITDAQMPQWNAFAEALRANARRMSGMHETMMQGGMMNHGNAPMSAPDRLDRMERAMTAMLEGLKEMKATPRTALCGPDRGAEESGGPAHSWAHGHGLDVIMKAR